MLASRDFLPSISCLFRHVPPLPPDIPLIDSADTGDRLIRHLANTPGVAITFKTEFTFLLLRSPHGSKFVRASFVWFSQFDSGVGRLIHVLNFAVRRLRPFVKEKCWSSMLTAVSFADSMYSFLVFVVGNFVLPLVVCVTDAHLFWSAVFDSVRCACCCILAPLDFLLLQKRCLIRTFLAGTMFSLTDKEPLVTVTANRISAHTQP